MTIQATLSAAAICLILGVIPFLGSHFDRPEFYEYRHIFWMMLTGVLIKSATESLYYVMYARGQDKAIWAMSFFLWHPRWDLTCYSCRCSDLKASGIPAFCPQAC